MNAGVRAAKSLVLGLVLTTAWAPAQAWAEVGPVAIVPGAYTGRVAAVACSATDANVYYVGGAGGGVWRTADGGVSWTAIGDQLPTTAVGAVSVDPRDDNIVYAGLGEANFANHSAYGLGFARSRDAGQTWDLRGAAEFAGRCFARLRVDPQNGSILYAATGPAGGFPAKAAARNHPLANGPVGLWKSTDAGDTWTQLGGGLPQDLAVTDVVLDPSTPATVFAAVGHIFGDSRNGVYKSTDAGATFVKLGGGLPTASVGRIALALAASQPSRVVAAIARVSDATGGGASTLGAYRSDNGGTTWTSINPGSYHATYGWYLNTAAISPSNPNVVLLGGFDLKRSTAGGGSWSTVTPPHVDLHALEFDASGRLLCGNDGGIHRSANNGTGWTSINANLSLTQLYAGLSVYPNGTAMLAGLQDNGTVLRTGGVSWGSQLGGDGGYTSLDAAGTRAFAEFQGTGNLYRSLNGGSFAFTGNGLTGRNCFLPPHEVHPLDALWMVYGTERIFRSTNGGSSWAPISPDLTGGGSAAVSGLAFAPSDKNTIWAFTNDGRVQVTSNGGSNWQLRLTGIPTWPRTRQPFAVHPTAPQKCYLAVAAFGVAKLRYTQDGGQAWSVLDGNLPDVPASCVAIDLQSGEPPVLYLGTDAGVWRSQDHGTNWALYGTGLPNVPVVDLRVDPARNRLVAATQGRGVLTVALTARDDLPAVPPRRQGQR